MTEGNDLTNLGEFGLIDRIARRLPAGAGVTLGIGDDAAAFAPSPGQLSLITTDTLVEGVHFDLSYSDPFSLGKKALSVNLSDIAAMGGKPRHYLLSLAIPPAMTLDFLDNFIGGMLSRADQFGACLIGGDTCSSSGPLVLTLTVLGEQSPDLLVRRSGAHPGDQICVTGTLGDSALGLRLLRQGGRQGNAIARHLDPVPRVLEGLALAEASIPSAMIDLSDGLLADLGHILDLSDVGAQIYSQALPLSDTFREHFPAITEEALSLALSGGEDYELLFTVPPEKIPNVFPLLEKLGTPVSVVGTITAEHSRKVIGSDGREIFLNRKGYDHFSGRETA